MSFYCDVRSCTVLPCINCPRVYGQIWSVYARVLLWVPVGCPAEMYKWSASSDRCLRCPHHSSAAGRASALCQCDDGYYRAAHDKPSEPCTRTYPVVSPIDAVGDESFVYVSHKKWLLPWLGSYCHQSQWAKIFRRGGAGRPICIVCIYHIPVMEYGISIPSSVSQVQKMWGLNQYLGACTPTQLRAPHPKLNWPTCRKKAFALFFYTFPSISIL